MRLLLGVALSTSLLLSTAAAAPAKSACGPDSESVTLAGSRWSGAFTWDGDPSVAQTMTLRADCVVEYRYKGVTYTNGRWLQRNQLLLWDTNNHYAAYSGTVDGSRMSGVMYNQGGDQGTWSIKRAD